MKNFDPNAAAALDSGIFGLPFTVEEAKLVLIPVPWEITTSYGGGTSQGPQAILQASKQVDLYDLELGPFYEAGIAMMDESTDVHQWNKVGQEAAAKIIMAGGEIDSPELKTALQTVNQLSKQLNHYVYTETKNLLAQGKSVGIVGGAIQHLLGRFKLF